MRAIFVNYLIITVLFCLSVYSKKQIEHKCKTNCTEITHTLINLQIKSFNHFLKPL